MIETMKECMHRHGYIDMENEIYGKLDKEFPYHFHLAFQNEDDSWDELELTTENIVNLLQIITGHATDALDNLREKSATMHKEHD